MSNTAHIDDLWDSLKFIQMIKNVSLDDEHAQLDAETIYQLQNPPEETPQLDDLDLQLSLKILLATDNAAEETYTKVQEVFQQEIPEQNWQLEELTVVTSIVNDMCPATCAAYVGPYAHMESFPVCAEPQYDQAKLQASNGRIKSPCCQYHTM
ncbi:hypothetical protein PAXRUDRAFT_35033 [Paxillus rubicundulus Ve08.2h10]|uniref:Uncharacterized protein n=1 Tax=Paxillus rubicundulus Ve08.2h10 TaxID=930991 RepID=A0A0D0DJD4_9AGAM|nr:hypothetical protein PAXRUDRAFT_35033 [Paxillus rubicundulus Ve08.2h10]